MFKDRPRTIGEVEESDEVQTAPPKREEKSFPRISESPFDNGTSRARGRSRVSSEKKSDQIASGTVLIGEGVLINGEVRNCKTVEIRGTIEGDIEAENAIVHQDGKVNGSLTAHNLEIGGVAEGKIAANGTLNIYKSGSVNGQIAYGELIIEPGAIIIGDLSHIPSKPKEAGSSNQDKKPKE